MGDDVGEFGSGGSRLVGVGDPGDVLGGGGVGFPGGVGGLGDNLAAGAVLVVGAGLSGPAGEVVTVGDAVDLGHVPGAAVGQSVAGHAEEVRALGLGAVGSAGQGTHRAVAAEVVPAALLVERELVRVASPVRAVGVLVGRGLRRRAGAGGGVVLHHLGHHVLVEPVLDRVDCAVRRPPGRVTALGVLVRCGQVAGGALCGAVGDQRVGAGLAGDPGDAVLVQRGAALGGIDPVRHQRAAGGDLRRRLDVGQRTGFGGVLDRGKPQRGRRDVSSAGVLVRQGPGVDRLHRAALQGEGVDRRQALARPERRGRFQALLVGCAVQVHRHVRPAGGVVLVEGAVGQAPVRHAELHLTRRVGGGERFTGTQAVVDTGQVAAADIGDGVVDLVVLRVVAGLLGVVQGHGVVVRVHDVVEVPAPALGLHRGGEVRVVAGFTAVVAVDRNGEDGVRLVLAAAPPGQAVLPEPVLGAVDGGELPVLVVLVAVHIVRGTALDQLDA